MIRIYTDGACDPNPGPGGWGAVVLRPGAPPLELSGRAADTTHHRMELTAALEALSAIEDRVPVEVYTDSQYLCAGVTTRLPRLRRFDFAAKSGEPVDNADLWRALSRQVDRREVRWRWVKGHAGDRWNECADQLARRAR